MTNRIETLTLDNITPARFNEHGYRNLLILHYVDANRFLQPVFLTRDGDGFVGDWVIRSNMNQTLTTFSFHEDGSGTYVHSGPSFAINTGTRSFSWSTDEDNFEIKFDGNSRVTFYLGALDSYHQPPLRLLTSCLISL